MSTLPVTILELLSSLSSCFVLPSLDSILSTDRTEQMRRTSTPASFSTSHARYLVSSGRFSEESSCRLEWTSLTLK
ncbi:hypothetical protein B0J15DRAFT_228054 [Fusarium solani]|uniref:Secreted protein n=1 Tax=Fusarium solani TaxID=169388 RepID=A0A9P9G0V2_FUSSL|nr:uncharacterized protein B0J15DRAFT_228054 [Fusarium solani]KAH7228614.1 hypothetical protein B0J15DRAFT_228054 [Fusarium solani]